MMLIWRLSCVRGETTFNKVVVAVIFVAVAFTGCTVSAQSKNPLEGTWVVRKILINGLALEPHMPVAVISGQTLQMWDLWKKTDDEEEYVVKTRYLNRFHFVLVKGKEHQINIIPRAIPPYKGRKLSKDELKYASTGYKGIFRLKDDVLEIYFPMRSDRPRPKQIVSKDGSGHQYFQLKRLDASKVPKTQTAEYDPEPPELPGSQSGAKKEIEEGEPGRGTKRGQETEEAEAETEEAKKGAETKKREGNRGQAGIRH